MDGILLVDKIANISTFDIIRKIKKIFKENKNGSFLNKIGHAGTLDPIATGLVILLINNATKLAFKFLNLDKIYDVELFIGFSTNTYDSTGIITEKKVIEKNYFQNHENLITLHNVLNSFIGEILQEPPMFSAIKKNGVPLYKLARKNLVIERNLRKCTIYSIKPNINIPTFDEKLEGFCFKFIVHCSKGTYVRSLCNDIGIKLNIPCHMKSLRRIAIGDFNVSDALSYDKINDVNTIINFIKPF